MAVAPDSSFRKRFARCFKAVTPIRI
jgi:hypothetical protein